MYFLQNFSFGGKILSDNLTMFGAVTKFLHLNSYLKIGNFTKLITEHLQKLKEEINDFFQILVRMNLCLKNLYYKCPGAASLKWYAI